MNTCAECRFWVRDYEGTSLVTDGFRQCAREQHPEARIRGPNEHSHTIWTRSDFGCVQFEDRPMPETMPVLYADEGEYVEPIPGHRFGPFHWKRAQPIGCEPMPDIISRQISINGQWFEIRPQGIEPGTYVNGRRVD